MLFGDRSPCDILMELEKYEARAGTGTSKFRELIEAILNPSFGTTYSWDIVKKEEDKDWRVENVSWDRPKGFKEMVAKKKGAKRRRRKGGRVVK